MSLFDEIAKKLPLKNEDLQPNNVPAEPTERQRLMSGMVNMLTQNLPPAAPVNSHAPKQSPFASLVPLLTQNLPPTEIANPSQSAQLMQPAKVNRFQQAADILLKPTSQPPAENPPLKTGYGQLINPDVPAAPDARVNTNLPTPQMDNSEDAPIPSEYEKAGWNLQGAMNAPVVNKDHGIKGMLREIAQNYLAGAAQLSQNPNASLGSVLGGGLGSAAGGVINRTANEQRMKDANIQKRMGEYGVQKQIEDDQLARRRKIADIVFAEQRPDVEQQKIAQKGQELDARTKSNAMRVVASVYNKLPSFDSKDPENADMVAQMQEVGLPVIDKNPNKDIRYVQDEDSGEMFLVSTDKQTGETSAEQVMQNGQPLKIATKSQIGMRVKDLDRTSREKIAEARNNTLLKVTGINAGSREKVAGMNIQGAGDRVQKQISAADDRQKLQLVTTSLQRWQQQFTKSKFRQPNEEEITQAKQSIQKTIYGQ